MPITATCANCGKTYQAPERMAGKAVRCKQCGEIFRVELPSAGEGPENAVGGIDLDALERSFSDAEATSAGSVTASRITGPMIDKHGKAHIRRDADVDGLALEGEGVPAAMRSNFRYRYPGAKQIDQLLPWALVLLTLFVIVQSTLNTQEAVVGETMKQAAPRGIAIGRAAILLALYAVIVWPLSHIAIVMASRKLRFSMPRAPGWRTFAGFMPVLMLGAGLYTFSGGDVTALVMGLIVGITLSVGTIAVLFRAFPNEIPIVGGYAAGGAAAGAAFSVALLVAANLVATSIAKSDPNTQLRVSPIAIGMPWIEKPVPPVAVGPTKTRPTNNTGNTTNPAGTPTPVPAPNQADPAPENTGPIPLELPYPQAGQAQLLRSLELAPIRPGFDAVIVPLVASDALGVVRAANGGRVETWDRDTFAQPTREIGRDFDAMRSPLYISPAGTRVIRLVSDPYDRIEELPLGNRAVLPPKRVEPTNGQRAIFGLLSEGEVFCTVRDGTSIALEQYSIADNKPPLAAEPLLYKRKPIALGGTVAQTLRMLPDGSGLVVACRQTQLDGSVGDPRVLRYDLTNLQAPVVDCQLWLNRSVPVAPVGLAIDATGNRAAMLLLSGGELNLTIFDVTPGGASGDEPRSAKLDRKIGLHASLRPSAWEDGYDPLVWLDERTLLIYGRLFDAQTGRSLGETGLTNIVGVLPQVDRKGRVMLLLQRNDGRALVRATFDAAAIAKARE